MKEFRELLIKDCEEELVLLSESDFALEPMYFKWGLSESAGIRLRSGVLEKLREARAVLRARPGCEGWDFKIWDGYRTLKVQQILYDDYWKDLEAKNGEWTEEELHEAVQVFVSLPSRDRERPSPHNTGAAVDLTLVDAQGEEIPMGSEFDEFNEKSYSDHFADGEFFENRRILIEVLEGLGFVNYPQEWWHFSYGDLFWAGSREEGAAIYGSKEI